MFLTKNNFRRTAWYMAEENGNLELLYKTWDWAKNVLTPEVLNNKLFYPKILSKDVLAQSSREGQTRGITKNVGVG
jgi:hypothetical protein